MSRIGKLIAVSSAALLLLLTGCSSDGDTAAADGTIKLGLVTSLTGDYSTLGEGNVAGAQAAVNFINAQGGVNGQQLELVIKDDKTVADQSVVGFNEVISDDGVVAVIGSTDSTSATAVAPAAERAGVVYLGLSPVTALASGENPWAFITPTTTANYSKKLVDYWSTNGYENIAIAYDSQDVFGESGFTSTRDYAEEAGLNIVLAEAIDPSASDYTATLTKLQSSDADALMVWAAGPSAVVITKQHEALAIDTQLFMSGAQGSQLYLEPSEGSAEGVILAASIAVAGDELPDGALRDRIDEVADPFIEEEGYYPTEFYFNGASAVFILAAAIEEAESLERDAIRDSLEQVEILVPTGSYHYSADDHGGLDTHSVSIIEVRDGQFDTTDYQVELFETELPE